MTVTELVRTNLWTVRAENMRFDKGRAKDGADRGKSKWSQEAVASRLGMPTATYRGLEVRPARRGHRRGRPVGAKQSRVTLTIDEVVALAVVLNCDVPTLLSPSKDHLDRGDDFELSGWSEGHSMRISADRWRLWLDRLKRLPQQNRTAYDRLTGQSRIHDAESDTRGVKPRVTATSTARVSGRDIAGGWDAAGQLLREEEERIAGLNIGDLGGEAKRTLSRLVSMLEGQARASTRTSSEEIATDDDLAAEWEHLTAVVEEIGRRLT